MADHMTQPTTLVSRDVTIARGPHTVVRDVNLELKSGDVLGLVGSNGVGKSTTLACLAGLIAPAAGAVEIGGFDMAANPTDAKRLIGYLPDPPALHNELCVTRHLYAMAALYGIHRRARAAVVERAIAQTSLEAVSARRIGRLSQGFRQRVGLAQAILHEPKLILLDEPTNGLDIEQQARFAASIARISETAAVILSSHHMSDIRACCNRLAVLEGGVLSVQPKRDRSSAAETLFLKLQQPVTAADLHTLPCVLAVRIQGAGWLVSIRGDAVELSSLVNDRGWGLMQLSPVPNRAPSESETRKAASRAQPELAEPVS